MVLYSIRAYSTDTDSCRIRGVSSCAICSRGGPMRPSGAANHGPAGPRTPLCGCSGHRSDARAELRRRGSRWWQWNLGQSPPNRICGAAAPRPPPRRAVWWPRPRTPAAPPAAARRVGGSARTDALRWTRGGSGARGADASFRNDAGWGGGLAAGHPAAASIIATPSGGSPPRPTLPRLGLTVRRGNGGAHVGAAPCAALLGAPRD